MKKIQVKSRATRYSKGRVWPAWQGSALFLSLFLLISFLLPPLPVQAQTINKIGYTNSQNGSNLRNSPTTSGSTVLAVLPTGSKVEVFEKVTGGTANGSNEWYRVRYIKSNIQGYVHAPLVTLSSMPVNPTQPTGDTEFVQYLADQGFPESYWPALRLLHQAHPNWIFVPHHVRDLDSVGKTWAPLAFQKAVNVQLDASVPARSLVNKSSLLSHRTYEKPGYDYKTDTWTSYDAGGWMRASRAIVAYSMDPRNFLDEGTIFQFEQLSYNSSVHTRDALVAAAQGTFLGKGDTFNFTDLAGNPRTNQTYADIFLYAAEVSGVNPFFLMQRCLTEVSAGGSDSVTGKVGDYLGYYNFFNIGAYSSNESPISNGLRYAKYGSGTTEPTATDKSRYLLPWDSPWKAIVGGAKWIARGYIIDDYGNPLQDTSYSQKFHLDGDIYGTYWHQYMGNIGAPANESGKVFAMYMQRGLLDQPFVFKIPVMADLPATVSPYPSDDRSQNNWLKSLTLSKGSLSPAFNPEQTSYTVTVDETVSQITLNATAYHSKCTIKNTGTKNLSVGLNTLVVEAVSESGQKRNYTLKITRQGPPPPALTVTAGDSYVIKDSFISNASPGDKRNTAGQILAGISLTSGYSAKAYDASGNLASASSSLGTGARIDIFYGSDASPTRSLSLLIYGDINGDGRFNSIDLTYLIDAMFKGKRWTAVQNSALDVNRDGKINSIDLTAVINAMFRGAAIKQN